MIATTRVLDLAAAETLVAAGDADAVGMTRALIADPELVAKAAAGEPAIGCIGCNQACIGHYHAGVPIGCVVNPRSGRELTMPVAVQGPARVRALVIGGGPAGVAAALEAAAHGDAVVLAERDGFPRGAVPAGRPRPGAPRAVAALGGSGARPARRGGDRGPARRGGGGGRGRGLRRRGPRHGRPPLRARAARERPGARPAPGRRSPTPRPSRGPSSSPTGAAWDGLDAAERLAEAGAAVTLACAAPCPGDVLHQYQRNLYLARLDEAGIAVLHHTELAAEGDRLVLRHVFSARTASLPDVATVVLAHGRVPEDDLWAVFEGQRGRIRAGDALGPRSMEEAILEGVTAYRAARAAVLAG